MHISDPWGFLGESPETSHEVRPRQMSPLTLVFFFLQPHTQRQFISSQITLCTEKFGHES